MTCSNIQDTSPENKTTYLVHPCRINQPPSRYQYPLSENSHLPPAVQNNPRVYTPVTTPKHIHCLVAHFIMPVWNGGDRTDEEQDDSDDDEDMPELVDMLP
jgi:hypothetical protein